MKTTVVSMFVPAAYLPAASLPMRLMDCQTIATRDLKLGMHILPDPWNNLVNVRSPGGVGGGGDS